MSENKAIEVKFEEGKALFNVDSNKDGEPSLKIELNLTEAVQEIFNRGGKIEGAKVVDFSFELTKLKLKLDTDQDGEHLLDLTIDLAEAVDEVTNLFKKDAPVAE